MISLFSDSEWDARAVCWIIIFFEICSLALNTLILFKAVRLIRKNLSHALTFLICATDLLLSLDVLIKYSLRLAYGKQIVLGTAWFCSTFWTICYTLGCMSSIFISLLALERYLQVCRGTCIHPLGVMLGTLLAFVALLFLGIMTSVTDGYNIDSKGMFCMLGTNIWSNLLMIIAKLCFVISLLVICTCYLNIYFFCQRINRRFSSNIHTKKTLLPILIYLTNYLPVFIHVVLAIFVGEFSVPPGFFVMSFISAVTIPASNSFLVLSLHQQIRDSLAELFQKPKAIQIHECSCQA
ncbi:hypothetical protein DSO57_1013224 [Entomophthora muscae]|uniref:Uncharacterized protein n=1 Tax=Entomophthora muscae TaxID=34485 RepID=A0ACC2TSW3_9FUNG|nr:hypothetical protein DSO57_1013224 [Entomophthora muscae]